MTDKREFPDKVNLPLLTKERSEGWSDYWSRVAVDARKQLWSALTKISQLEQQVKAQQGRQDAEKATKDKPTFAYDLAMYLTKNGRELTIEEMQYRIENFVYRSCWEVRTK